MIMGGVQMRDGDLDTVRQELRLRFSEVEELRRLVVEEESRLASLRKNSRGIEPNGKARQGDANLLG
jgi:hypothetical protein